MLAKLHSKIGDLWWYSAIIFVACRSGDVIQAFIGLWLVPKYVGQEELGAVLPLQQLCGLFAVPLAILATVFAKYVNVYMTRGEIGKVKSFIHDILIASAILFLVCIAFAWIVAPHFYSRLNVASGSLTILILAAGFTGNISQLFNSALQGMKKFKTTFVVTIISAPIRLATLLVAMPFRALSGYILGQATPPASSSIVAAFSIHSELSNVKADTSWRKDIPEILRYFWPIAICSAPGAVIASVSATVYRQRLPEIESAAYYLISRFAEIASYVGASMMFVLVPLAAEAHEKGRENKKFLIQSILATVATTTTLGLFFAFSGEWILSITETWHIYIPFVHLLPLMTALVGTSVISASIVNYEIACRRFSAAFFNLIFSFVTTAIIVSFTGYNFYRGILSDNIVNWMADHNFCSLTRLTWFTLLSSLIQIPILLFISFRPQRETCKPHEDSFHNK